MLYSILGLRFWHSSRSVIMRCVREGCGTLTSIFISVYPLRVEVKRQVFKVSEPDGC